MINLFDGTMVSLRCHCLGYITSIMWQPGLVME